jgi:hypothetical protein
VQVSGSPANIIKPYTSLDSSCQLHNVKANSLYNESGSSGDNENSIEHSDKGESMKNSQTFTLQLNGSPRSHTGSMGIATLSLVFTLAIRYL